MRTKPQDPLLQTLGTPAGASVSADIAAVETKLGSPAGASVSADVAALQAALQGGTDAVNRAAGKLQMKATTIDLHQAAGTYDLFTGTTQDVIVEKLSFRLPNIPVSDDAAITSIAIATNDVSPHQFITAVDGAKANLTAEVQITWTGACLLKAGKKIQLTIAGGTADAETVCDVVAQCRAVVSGGYLA